MERIVLTAREGYIYTDGENYGKTIYLAIGASADNWYEITEEEYNGILARQEENVII